MSEPVEDMVVGDAGVRSSLDTQVRRKRHRQRRKRKSVGLPYQPRRGSRGSRGGGTASVRAQDIRNEMFTNGQPVAPYNTTQFLIEDHGDLQKIDAQLRNAPDTHRHSRTRDSSFSIDSDEDYFYSSPEDEEEFLTKEFSLEYHDVHVERLNSLPKVDIIRDYLLLESKYEKSVAELRKLKTDSGRDTDASSRSDAEISEQLRQALMENRRLKAEIEKVKRANLTLKMLRARDAVSSVDSESDSSSSSSSTDSDSDSAPASPQAADSPPELPGEAAMPPPSEKSEKEVEMLAAVVDEDEDEVEFLGYVVGDKAAGEGVGCAQERFNDAVRSDEGVGAEKVAEN